MDKDKKQLLKHLKNTYCRVAPSKIDGVGVVAIKKIPKGVNPFGGSKYQKHIGLTEKEIAELDPWVQDMIKGFFVAEENKFWVPKNGLNNMDVSYYMNHATKPNVFFIDKVMEFRTKREIKPGEELTINYDKF